MQPHAGDVDKQIGRLVVAAYGRAGMLNQTYFILPPMSRDGAGPYARYRGDCHPGIHSRPGGHPTVAIGHGDYCRSI